MNVHPDRAPDGALKKAGATFVGDGIQNADATDQMVRVGRQRGGSVAFFARFTNAGDTASRFGVRPTDADPGLAVRYYEGRTASDITRTVKDGTYRTPRLAPGAAATVRIEVTVKQIARHLVEHDITLRAASQAVVPQIDVVRVRLHVN